MTQNRSHAVMAQRAEPHDSLDFFPTPPWATRALFEHCIKASLGWEFSVWEPACGDGAMSRPIGEYASAVWSSDVHNYGWDHVVHDFLQPYIPDRLLATPDFVVTNPPFRLGEQFIERALTVARFGVAMLVRSQFLEGIGRYKNLFSKRPPTLIAQFTERVPMVKGRLDREASTATAYCWMIWIKMVPDPGQRARAPTEFIWIPPCRAHLERADDYPVLLDAAE